MEEKIVPIALLYKCFWPKIDLRIEFRKGIQSHIYKDNLPYKNSGNIPAVHNQLLRSPPEGKSVEDPVTHSVGSKTATYEALETAERASKIQIGVCRV